MSEKLKLDFTQKVLVLIHDSLERNEPITKRHKLNDFLGFGLRKDDVCLNPFMDNFERWHHQTHSLFSAWVNTRVRPYVNHAESLETRRLQNAVLEDLVNGAGQILKHVEQPYNSEQMRVTSLQIHASVIVAAAALIARFSSSLEPNRSTYLLFWYNAGLRISYKLQAQATSDADREFIAVARDLQSVIEASSSQ